MLRLLVQITPAQQGKLLRILKCVVAMDQSGFQNIPPSGCTGSMDQWGKWGTCFNAIQYPTITTSIHDRSSRLIVFNGNANKDVLKQLVEEAHKKIFVVEAGTGGTGVWCGKMILSIMKNTPNTLSRSEYRGICGINRCDSLQFSRMH